MAVHMNKSEFLDTFPTKLMWADSQLRGKGKTTIKIVNGELVVTLGEEENPLKNYYDFLHTLWWKNPKGCDILTMRIFEERAWEYYNQEIAKGQ